ncbi:hypothetical protein [Micromonospora sp. WMMD812]|uniref:hypothetical protein n=1 Tax=Micromonospora sp. WMMD812 TaxID=3015152 RepID=UPI00248ACBEF|nr:hypothetical protein [Micromonospora sp. WMMD812]WBB65396.1 hypothetical protein O7603_19530 [Micromonospora sp. WMMD812]
MSLNGRGDPSGAELLPTLFPMPEATPQPEATPRAPARRRARTRPEPAGEPPDPARPDDAAEPGAAETDPARPGTADEARRQLVFFGAETAEPTLADLAGLLAGPGEVVRMGGTARVSVVVDAAWRVHVLAAELAQRGLAASWEPTEDARHAVRTSYARTLKPLAVAWLRGTAKRPPAGFHLNGRRLRLWLAAAGVAEPSGFLLRLGAADQECWEPVGRALATVGVGGDLLAPEAGGPAYLITGRRRLRRLAELVGDRPAAAPAPAWPVLA